MKPGTAGGRFQRPDSLADQTYDDAGNMLTRTKYAYTMDTLGTPLSTQTFTYGDSTWGDLLTGINGTTVTSDTIGNILSDGTSTYTWKNGRQLATATKNGTTWTYTYDANGMRTTRTDGSTVYTYFYDGSNLHKMKVGNDTLTFIYGYNGHPMAVKYNYYYYYYVTNTFGDVLAILDDTGAEVVTYTYDAWGNILTTGGSMATTLGAYNPLRYRGYVYDQESGLYYLQSRYYNPAICRFISADSLIAPRTAVGVNQFVYCCNNPVSYSDPTGHWLETVFDLFSLGVSVVDVVINPLNPWAWAGLAGDALDLIPFATGIGESIKGMRVVAKGADLADDTLTTIRFAKAANYADEFADGGLDLVKMLDKTSDGFTISNRLDGIKIHKAFMSNGMKIPGTLLRADGLDAVGKLLYELKPYNKNSLRKGLKQIIHYNDILGGSYQMILVFY